MKSIEGQINLFVEQQKKDDEERWFQEEREQYNEWLTLAEKKILLVGTPERASLREMLETGYCKLWSRALHTCGAMPQDRYIWLNCIEPPEYWVLNEKGTAAGEHIDICPFCGAKLSAGECDAALSKAHPSYWVLFLYFDVPMHQKGFVTEEERKKLREMQKKFTWDYNGPIAPYFPKSI